MKRQQCGAQVEVRDTYRYTGRGKSGFSMHYRKRRCRRRAVVGDLCQQHHDIERRPGGYVIRWDR